jgi:hypothetical protein
MRKWKRVWRMREVEVGEEDEEVEVQVKRMREVEVIKRMRK